MLVLSRKLGQRFHVGNDVRVTIVKIDRNSVRIGVEAPNDVNVYREEIIPLELEKDQGVEVRGGLIETTASERLPPSPTGTPACPRRIDRPPSPRSVVLPPGSDPFPPSRTTTCRYRDWSRTSDRIG